MEGDCEVDKWFCAVDDYDSVFSGKNLFFLAYSG